MPFKLNKNDVKLLVSVAEYRILTVSQIAALSMRSKQVVRRRLRKLGEHGFVINSEGLYGFGRGRQERIFSIGPNGVARLRETGELDPGISEDKLDADQIACKVHQALVNWFRIHIDHVSRRISGLTVRFLSPTSPFLQCDSYGRPLIYDRVPMKKDSKKEIGFTPDGAFSITHSQKQKTLLFFLEVDMGTETVASPKRKRTDVRQKILNYQAYFKTGKYKRYEEIWNCELNGFRLLFLTNSNARMATLCQLVNQMPPSDFIWLTDQRRMFSSGLSAEIWAKGGKHGTNLHSILGQEMACQNPISIQP